MTILSRWFSNWDGSHKAATIKDAQSILGPEKVFTASLSRLKFDTPSDDVPSLQSVTALLKFCAKQNRKKALTDDWRIFPLSNMSLWTLQERMKEAFTTITMSDFWLEPSESSWADAQPSPGYHILNVRPQYMGLSFDEQEERIAALRKKVKAINPQFTVERAHVAHVAEASILTYLLSKERLLRREVHCSNTFDSSGCRIKIGYFDESGLAVISCPDFAHKCHGVILTIRSESST
jgi:hypothetical protein